MFSISRSVAITVFSLLLSACGAIQAGQNFDARSFVTKVERGITTRDQVRGWLGAPQGTGVNVDTGGERFDEWTYYFASGKLGGMNSATVKILQIKFDRQGIVRGYNWSTSEQ